MRKQDETAKRQYMIRVSGDPYVALMGAVIESARNDGDYEAIEEWKELLFGDKGNPLQADYLNDREHGIKI